MNEIRNCCNNRVCTAATYLTCSQLARNLRKIHTGNLNCGMKLEINATFNDIDKQFACFTGY